MTAAFKQTDIGLIPADWDLNTIKDVFSFTKKPRTLEIDDDVEVPFLPMDIIPDNKIYVEDFELKKFGSFSSGTYFENGDILLAKITPSFENGKQAIARIPYNFGYATTEVIPINEIKNISSKHFLFNYLLKSDVRKILAGKMEGSTGRQRLPKTVLQNTLIPFPPLPEQKKIAYVLSKIQEAIETQEQIIKTTQELKKALMQKLFTEGLNGEPQKQTEIGPIPESWEITSIGDVCEQRKESYTPSPEGDSIYIGLEHIVSGEYNLCNHSIENTVVSSKYKFYKADLLYGKLRPYLDKAVLVNVNGICSTDIIVIKPKIDKNFLLALLHSESLLKHSIAHTSGVNHPRTSFDALSRFKFALPNPNKQREIGEALFRLEDKILLHKKISSELKDVFNTTLNKLMTGQIRVKDMEFKIEENINTQNKGN